MTAPALRDLGLFAAFMLVGTILFVLVFLPHLVGKRPGPKAADNASSGRSRRSTSSASRVWFSGSAC